MDTNTQQYSFPQYLYCLKSFILSELESNPEMIEDQLVEKFVYLSKDERYLHFLDGI